MSDKSDTPRTDRRVIRQDPKMCGCCYKSEITYASHARQLERELAEITKQLHHAVGLLSTTPQFENQHPEDILIALKGGQP